MYTPKAGSPCPLCTSILDSPDGSAPQIVQRINLAVVTRAPLEKIRNWALTRDWKNLRLLSSDNNSYDTDYLAASPSGAQLPAINFFHRSPEGIHHRYNVELLYLAPEEGQDGRQVDLIWPLFDLTPEGRGTDWFPKVSYPGL